MAINPLAELEMKVGGIEHVKVSIAIGVVGTLEGAHPLGRPTRLRADEFFVNEGTRRPDRQVGCRCGVDVDIPTRLCRHIVVHYKKKEVELIERRECTI